ncbi:CoA transferase [Nocardia gamkensis]|uniref:CaiB/BaiF CoA transferase family protein n=1 Tax=Nocardia gamkensis TaxID=352869 RepID=UPI0033E866E8
MSTAALSGIRVLDLSRILAGPFTTQLLGDLGADVVKVERPRVGDDARTYGPPYLHDRNGEVTPEAGFYLSCNRNKRSITVDHSKPEGAQLIRELAARSDILVENFRVGVLAKYGLDYASLQKINPRLIYCSITGFGQEGPYSDRPGYDGVFQAMSGMMSVSGHPDGEPGAGPMKVGVSMVDILTGLYASNAILAALHHRATTGTGQYIDMALLDCGVAALSHYAQNYLVSGTPAPRRGNGGFGGIPSQTFRCADDEIFVVASTPKQWSGLVQVLGRPELAIDPRFATVSARIANRDLVLSTLGEIFRLRPAREWVRALEAADVPVSPVNDMDGVFTNPQVRHRQLKMTIEHPDSGALDILRNPIRLSGAPLDRYEAPPKLGQHTHEVLSQVLDKSDEEIEKLTAGGVV